MEFPTVPKDRYNPLQTGIQHYGSHPRPVTQIEPSILFTLESCPWQPGGSPRWSSWWCYRYAADIEMILTIK
jgi:hypothetical protein